MSGLDDICLLPRLLVELGTKIKERNNLTSIHPRQDAVPLLDRSKLNELGTLPERLSFAPNGLGSRLGLHLRRVSLGFGAQLSLSSCGLRLRHALELLVLCLQSLLFGLDLRFDSAVELGRKIEIGYREIRDADGIFDAFLFERVVEISGQALLNLLFDELALCHEFLGGEFGSNRFDAFLNGWLDEGRGDLPEIADALGT